VDKILTDKLTIGIRSTVNILDVGSIIKPLDGF
jgi:hypothetical protein